MKILTGPRTYLAPDAVNNAIRTFLESVHAA